jgi:transcription initiation factor TFIIIB Brf1 subunit/transcription initiation factor TFIIB
MVDVDEEVVCSSCGSVRTKEVVASPIRGTARRVQAVDYTNHSLGSFLGPMARDRDDGTKGFSKSSSTFKYLKTVSDYSQMDQAGVYPCARLMERICEKLALPRGIIGQSITIAKGLLAIRKERTGYTIAAVSAFSIISACRIYGVSTVGMKEIIEAHRALGHKVRPSTLIKMGFDSPVRANAMRAEEHLGRVANRLSELLPKLGAPLGHQNRLLHIARRALGTLDSSERGGHSPCALAATSFYAAEMLVSESESRRRFFTQRDAAACVNVAEYTVREQFCELFRPRWDEICEELRPMLSPQHHGQPSQSVPSPLRLQAAPA